MERAEILKKFCDSLPRKHNRVFKSWYYEHNGYEMICVQMKREVPRYLPITNMPVETIKEKIDEMVRL